MKVNSLLSGIGGSYPGKGGWLLLSTTAFLILQGGLAPNAFAHSLTVTATASCSNGAATINYTVTSWDTSGDLQGSDPTIQVLFNGVLVDTEAFVLGQPGQFSGSKPAPLGTSSVDVEAVAAATWDDGFPSGETNTVTVPSPRTVLPERVALPAVESR